MATEITYKGAVIAAPEGGQTVTLKCKGMKMSDDITVTAKNEEEYKAKIIELIERTATEITVPEGVTIIGDYAFSYYDNLLSVFLPESLISIGGSALSHCSSLTSIIIPDSVTSIEKSTFYGCSSLTSITIPEGVTSIGNWAFERCSSLTSITIPEGVTSIGDAAFRDCSSLTTINVPWAEGAVKGAPWGAENATIYYNYVAEVE